MTSFTAHVQYDDWTGSAAADDADDNDLRDLLETKGLLAPGEFLIGFEMYAGDEIAVGERYFSAKAYIVRASDHDNAVEEALSVDPVLVTIREIPLDLNGFFALFKRFSVMLGDRSLGFHGREYRQIGQ
jgi:hypothetical protein